MSAAASEKRGKLEEEFSNRLNDAEASPSQDLWARIDHDLTVQENGAYKKRAAFYRQLAAACITLLLLAGGVGAYFFSGTSVTEKPLATVAPAASTAPSERGGMAGMATSPEQDANITTDPVEAGENPAAAESPIHATTGAASLAASPDNRSTATDADLLTQPDAAGSAVTEESAGTLAIAGTRASEAAEERPLHLSRSLRQTIADLSAIEEKAGRRSALLGQSFSATGNKPQATEDFRKLNEQVMSQAKRLEEEQKALLLALNGETTKKKASKQDGDRGNSGWSVGMAYAPSYFDQNIGLSNQVVMGAANDQISLTPNRTSAATISSLYMEDAREEYTENTDPGFSYGFEVKTGLKLGKRIKLLTGLGFLQNTTRSKSSYVIRQFWGSPGTRELASDGPSTIFIPSISANIATDSLYVAKTPEFKVNHRYRFLTVPVGLQYEGSMGKNWFWYGGAGVAANILMQATILASTAEVADVEYDLLEESPFRRLQWSGKVSGGVGKHFASNMSVTVGPEFRSYLGTLLAEPENAQAPQGRPYAVGLNMAVNYELNAGKKSR